jgi:hypothetical protein
MIIQENNFYSNEPNHQQQTAFGFQSYGGRQELYTLKKNKNLDTDL